MKIIKRLRNAPKPGNLREKRPIISRRFIIAISVIYSLLIIATAAAFHISVRKNAAILRDALATLGQELLLRRIEGHVSHLRSVSASTQGEIREALRSNPTAHADLFAVIIFTKTSDENYFRIADTIIFNRDLKLELPRSAVVREKKEISYLKRGLLQPAVDPDIYAQGSYSWQNVFYPYELGRRKAVLQFMATAAHTREIIENYGEGSEKTRRFMAIFILFLVFAVIVLSVLFVQNYSLLIRNLSRYMKKAAEGDLDVALHPADDVELNQLALSFNTLIEELKDKTARGQEATVQTGPSPAQETPEPEGPGTIFSTGVALLKENRLDEAIAIFTTMTIIKPNGFGSYFNLGVARAKKREYDAALSMFEKAREINPSYEVTASYIEKIKRLREPDE
ncbi:MAG: HAMP domain-containing protein [Spirochaetes bacterium]|nr:HAMP domain-containing protein [Spirochaetota bacterium]